MTLSTETLTRLYGYLAILPAFVDIEKSSTDILLIIEHDREQVGQLLQARKQTETDKLNQIRKK